MIGTISFEITGFLLVILVIGMCFGQRKVNFKAERDFMKMLCFALISIVIDIATKVLVVYGASVDEVIIDIMGKLMLFSVSVVACQSAWFAVAEIRYHFRKRWVYATVLPLIAEMIVFPLFPIGYRFVGNVICFDGIPVITTYAMCALYILACIVMVIILKDQIEVKRRHALYFWLGTWMFVGVVQVFHSNVRIVSFTMAFALVYMYCRLENPDYQVDITTNSFNRLAFQSLLIERLRDKKKNGLVILKLDGLDRISTFLGQGIISNAVLQLTDDVSSISETMVFKINNDLFAILVEDNNKMERVLSTVSKITSQNFIVNDVEVPLRVCISYLDDINEFKSVEELEEIITYFGNESTKSKPDTIICINEERLNERDHRVEIQNALDWALRNDTIEVYYQPVYNIEKGCFSMLEALVRIRDEKGTLLLPKDFLDYAERNGRIIELGERVFKKVCDFMRRMHVEQYGIETISVNLSTLQCMQEDLARTYKNIMGEYQIAPFRIVFEVAENTAGPAKAALEKNMKELTEYGCSFALDDYGTGNSNLSYVLTLNVGSVKLDKELAIDNVSAQKAMIATKMTVNMLHELGMHVVVEGIENEEQYLMFKDMGVEYIQGYYFSKPLSKDKVLTYVQEWL